MDWVEGARWAVEIVVVAVTAGIAVWRTVIAALDSKINGMEGRISSRLDSVDGDLKHIEGQLDDLSDRIRKNTQNIAVLSDRWERRPGSHPEELR